MVTINVEILGKEVFVRWFNRFSDLVKDWRPAFEQIHANYVQVTRRNFKSQGYPHRFKALSPAYRAWKQKHFPGKPILQRSGGLMDSMLGRGQSTRQHTVKDIKKLSAEFGTTLAYALAHQDGVPGRLPKRPPLQLQDRNMVFWSRIIHEWAYREAVKA